MPLGEKVKPAASKPSLWRLAAGPLLTAALAGTAEGLPRAGIAFADPAPLLLLAVALSGCLGGPGPALLSAALLLGYTGSTTYDPSATLFFSPADLQRLGMLAVTAPVLALSAGTLRRKLAAAELRASEAAAEWSGTVLRSIGDAVIATDAFGAIVFLNPAAERLTGWSAAEARGRELDDVFVLLDQKSREKRDSPLAAILDEGAEVPAPESGAVSGSRGEHALLVSRDGSEVAISDRGAPIRDAAGKVIGAVIVFRDASASRFAADTLRKSEEWYRRIVDTAHEGIWVLDAAGRTSYANWRMAEMLGYTAEEMAGRPLFDFVHDQNRPLALQFLSRLKRGVSEQQDYRLKRKGGGVLWVRGGTSPIRGESGDYIGALAMVTDVTDRKRLEEELRQRADELAESGRRKDEFLAMLAHELRNPLGAIRNALQLLRDPAATSQVRERAMSVVERQVQHQARMVDDLLDVSRITRGRIELRRERVNLVPLVRHACDDYRGEMDRAGLSLMTELPGASAWVDGDPTRLAQVLGNLIHNAIKFTEPGGRVTVRLFPGDEGARIEVEDTGVGIEAQMLPRVFEVFAQADRSLDRSRGGLGLGLGLVRGMVELHGGSVAVASEGLGKGSRFTVELPLLKDEVGRMKDESPANGVHHPSSLILHPSAKRVLVVEDNRDAAESLRDLLELGGHEVGLAHSGPDGLEEARRLHPEVVLCDIGLPGMDGYAVAEALRSDPATASVRLIALTGYGQDEDRRRSHEAGFDIHLTKPVDPNELQRLITA